jgi:prophage antirepressor-like protein
MSEIVLFECPDIQQELGVYIDENGDPWFRATNVCSMLGFANPVVALQTHCPNRYKEYRIGMGRPSNYVSEAGLYRLMLQAKAPIAERFRDWICDDVLPVIRRTGKYEQEEKSEFWELVDGSIARGLDPEKVLGMHKSFKPKQLRSATPKREKMVRGSEEWLLHRIIAVAQKFKRPVAAREVQQSCGPGCQVDPAEIRRLMLLLASKGNGEITGEGSKIRFSAPAPNSKTGLPSTIRG